MNQPGKSQFRAVFFSSRTIWLAPNDLVLFQLQKAFSHTGEAVFNEAFRPRLLTFSTLEALLANELSPPEADDLERRFILNGLAVELAEALEIGAGDDDAAHQPGLSMLSELADSLGDGLGRLKLAGISWDMVAGLKPARLAATLAELGRRHDESLVKLGRADRFAKRQMVLKLLEEGFGFRTLEGVRTINCHWSQRLSPFETDLLIALSRQYQVDVIFNIPSWVRNEDVSHGSGFDIVRTFREMEKHIGSNNLFLSYSDVVDNPLGPEALTYAAETLLAPPGYRRDDPPDPSGCLSITRVPSAYQEVEEAARHLKELVARGQSEPHDLALVVPDLNSYGPLIDDVGRRFGLAFHFRRGEMLTDHGPARAVMDLISVWSSNWERPRVVNLLASPYFNLTERKLAELSRLSLSGGVTDRRAGGGFEVNMAKLLRSRDAGPLAGEILKLVEQLKKHGQRLAAHKNWPDFFTGFKQLLGDLGWPGRIQESPAEPVNMAGADLAAAFAFKEELERLEEAMLSPYAPEVSLEQFRLWLRRVLEERHMAYDRNPDGRIWVLNYYDIHGGVFDEIFFLGLNERVFPQTSPSGRWWPEEFIKATSEASFLGRPLWSDVDDRYRQEELMLATGLGQARRRVRLFYHSGGEDGRAALPSPLLTQLKELWPEGVLEETERPWSIPPQPPMVRGEDELWASLIKVNPTHWPEQLRERNHWPEIWRDIHRRRDEWRQMRFSARPGELSVEKWLERLDSHNGRPLLRPDFLKNFADCPLAFWWSQTLGLKSDDEPLEEWPASREGTLLHDVLEKFFKKRLGPDGRPGRAWPGESDFEECRADLMEILAEEIKYFSGRMPVGRLPLWRARLKKLPGILTGWLKREFSRQSVRPWKMEWSFGTGENAEAPPFELPLNNGGSIYFKGRVDRIDDTEDGLAVRDYKLRSRASYKVKIDRKTGETIDVPTSVYPLAVYAMAASSHFGRPAQSYYEFIKASLDGESQTQALNTADAALSVTPAETGFNLPEHLRGLWGQVISGVYEPSGNGCDYCGFTALCPLMDKNEEGGEE
ncbi:hypothetical protein C4J81_17485 [Deltaproteobacteria bacterium Smac51]|nr:hypothetical protein C4J81_17485 [Deltaproteobacteria bacterium Smac51]